MDLSKIMLEKAKIAVVVTKKFRDNFLYQRVSCIHVFLFISNEVAKGQTLKWSKS